MLSQSKWKPGNEMKGHSIKLTLFGVLILHNLCFSVLNYFSLSCVFIQIYLCI